MPSPAVRLRLAALLAVALLSTGTAGTAQEVDTGPPRIVVGPDYLVSRDGDRPHVEIMAAANPKNPRNLIAGVITFTRPDGGSATKAYVSRDGGIGWDDITFAEQKEMGGADPQVAFTAAGTAIFATLATGPDETGRTRAFLHSYRSGDEGRTWSAAYNLGASYDHPMLVADQTTGRYAGRLYMSVLYGGLEYSLGVFRSEDDGRSWIGPVKFIDGGGERGLNVDPMLVFHDGAIMVPFVDFPFTPEQTAAWTESRIWTVVSTDGGVTFSAEQFQPAIEVNNDGVLGVTWYDTRDAPPGEFAFHEYFAASFDGGETFTEPHRVSSALSRPLGSGNLLPTPAAFSGPDGELRVGLLSAASRWVNGGDYMGLTTTADGRFHPVWADSRSGTYQVYTAQVRIEVGGAPAPAVQTGDPIDVTNRIELVTDPGRYDAETGVLDLWIRLRNVSATPIAGPIEVEIRKFGSGMDDTFAEFAPEILNADNGLPGDGAVFVYRDALGAEGVLGPDGVSGAILWRMRLADPIRIPNLHVYVTGREVSQP